MAEGLQASDEAFSEAFGVAALEVVAAELAVGLAGGEHVPVGDEHRVLDSTERAAVADPRLEALILGLEVAALGAGGGQRAFLERDPEELAGAPRGAMRKEMKDEQHLIRAGWNAGPGLMQRPGEAGVHPGAGSCAAG